MMKTEPELRSEVTKNKETAAAFQAAGERRYSMKIGIGNDHSALELKAEIIEFLKEKIVHIISFPRAKVIFIL